MGDDMSKIIAIIFIALAMANVKQTPLVAHRELVKESLNPSIEEHVDEIRHIKNYEAFLEQMETEAEERVLAEYEAEQERLRSNHYAPSGDHLTRSGGVYYYGNQKETYYNLPMDGVIGIMTSYGYSYDDYWVREDGCKMLGDYIMIAANLDVHPRGSVVDTSLGLGLVCDTGGFAYSNPYAVDIATNW